MINDIRYALRAMMRNRGTTAIAALALALGIGANTAIFSVVDAALLRPLAFKDSERLVWIWNTNPSRNLPYAFMPYWTFEEWRRQLTSLESASAYQPGSANLTSGAEPERLSVLRVNASFLTMLGVQPALGRDFLAEEDRPGAARVVLLDNALWQRRFGSNRGIVGQSIILDSQPHTVIGVLPAGFQVARPSDVYIPLALPAVRGQGGWSVGAYARIRKGVPISRAQTEIDGYYRRLAQDIPPFKGWSARIWGLREFIVRDVQLTLWVLLGAVALVLLIACANVANLLLARSGSRRREIAMRIAMGAGRARLLRQLLTESVLLGLAGGALGLLFAFGGVRLFKLAGPEQFPMLAQTSIDVKVLLFTLGVSLATGLLFGLGPALAAARTEVYENLKEGGHGSGESLRRNRARSALVVAEMALALLLMTGASLMIRSLVELQKAHPGFNPEGVLTASVTLPAGKYPAPDQRVGFYRQLLERINAAPGIRSAGMTTLLPLGGANVGVGLLVEGQPPPRPGEQPIFYQRVVDPNYFQAMQIGLKSGRLFTERDTGQPRTAIINETMARRHWPNQNPVGKRFGNGRDWMTVIGVVAGVRHTSLAQEPEAEFYEPYPQNPGGAMNLVVRTAGDPLRFAPTLRGIVRELDPDLPVSRVGSMRQSVENSTASRRFSVILLGVFGAVALVLAAVGIYGVISFSVARRTREIGVRMALGAGAQDVLRMVVGQALVLALAGVALGIAGGLGLARVIRTLLYGISPTDPLTMAGMSLILLGVAALAGYLPARRAARVDPVVALREE